MFNRECLARAEEIASQANQKSEEKSREILQLQTQLELTRAESSRQTARLKERLEETKRTLQNQVSDLVSQLAQSKTAHRSAIKERDEVTMFTANINKCILYLFLCEYLPSLANKEENNVELQE